MEPLWKGQESLTKVAKFGPFPCTILYKSYLFYPSWQATSFERPLSWVAFIEGFHCSALTGACFACLQLFSAWPWHYTDVIMGAIVSQITSLTIVYSVVYSDADQKKHQSSASLAFVRGIHRGPHKWPVTRKMFPFDDVIMDPFAFSCSFSMLA